MRLKVRSWGREGPEPGLPGTNARPSLLGCEDPHLIWALAKKVSKILFYFNSLRGKKQKSRLQNINRMVSKII